eukprot:gene657-812_t
MIEPVWSTKITEENETTITSTQNQYLNQQLIQTIINVDESDDDDDSDSDSPTDDDSDDILIEDSLANNNTNNNITNVSATTNGNADEMNLDTGSSSTSTTTTADNQDSSNNDASSKIKKKRRFNLDGLSISTKMNNEEDDEGEEDETTTTTTKQEQKQQLTSIDLLTKKVDWTDFYMQLFNSDNLQLVTWSSDNFLAFTTKSDKNLYMKQEQQPIYIMRAEIPHEYTVIKTSHLNMIRYLEWSNQAPGSILLSYDQSAKWVSINPSYYPIFDPKTSTSSTTKTTSPFESLSLTSPNEHSTQLFITLSKDGKINIVYFNLLESCWKQIQSEISLPPYHSIDCADIISTKEENIMISFYSKKMGNIIFLYQITFDIITNYVTNYELDKINLRDLIQEDKMLQKTKRNQKISSIIFDNTGSIIVLMKGLDSCILYRWEKKETSNSRHNAIISLLTTNSNQQITEWTCTANRFFCAINPKYPPISSIHYSNITGVLWLNYTFGQVEVVNALTFERISKIKLSNQNLTTTTGTGTTTNTNNAGTNGLSKKMKRKNRPISLSIIPSPNGCLAACLTSDMEIKLLALPIKSYSMDVASKWLSHLLQNAIIRSTDWWDVLVMLKIYSTSSEAKNAFHHTIIKLSVDYTALSVYMQSLHRSSFDSIKSSIYRIVKGMETAFVDSQAKSFIYYLSDTLKSSYLPLTQDPHSKEKENILILIDWVIEFVYKEKSNPGSSSVDTNKVKYSDCKELDKIIKGVSQIIDNLSTNFVEDREPIKNYLNNLYGSIVEPDKIDTIQTPYFTNPPSSKIETILKVLFTFQSLIDNEIVANINDMAINNSFSILDLDPPLDGFLDQNPIIPGENVQVSFKYAPKSLEYMGIVHDIITRIPIAPRIDKPYKKCTRCHRITVVLRTSLFWSDRWSLACPLCGGRWKLYQTASSHSSHNNPTTIATQSTPQQQQQQQQQQHHHIQQQQPPQPQYPQQVPQHRPNPPPMPFQPNQPLPSATGGAPQQYYNAQPQSNQVYNQQQQVMR